MSNCKEIQEFFSEYLDQALDEEKSQLVKEHISSCPTCRKDLEQLRKMSELLSGLGKKQPPPDFLEMLYRRIESRKSLDKFLRDLLKSPNLKVPVALCLVGLFLFALLRATGLYYPSLRQEAQVSKDTKSIQGSLRDKEQSARFTSMSPIAASDVAGWDKTVIGGGYQKPDRQREARTYNNAYRYLDTRENYPADYASDITFPGAGVYLEKAELSAETAKEYVLTINTENLDTVREKMENIFRQLAIEIVSPLAKETAVNRFVLKIKLTPQKLSLLSAELDKLKEKEKASFAFQETTQETARFKDPKEESSASFISDVTK
jgi:anti-sigma factor RsiW